MSATSGVTTSNSESISTFRRAGAPRPDRSRGSVSQAHVCRPRIREYWCRKSYERSWISSRWKRQPREIAGSRKTPEFFNPPFRIVSSGQLLKLFADHLVEALAKRLCPLSGTLDRLLANR